MIKNGIKVWVIVMDRKKAFFYEQRNSKKLVKLEHTINAKPLRTDSSTRKSLGRVVESGSSERHIIEPHTDDRTQEIEGFAREVSKYLEESFLKHIYNRLMLIAPPKVLGAMRKRLSDRLKGALVLELDKDLINYTPKQLQAQLFNVSRGERPMNNILVY